MNTGNGIKIRLERVLPVAALLTAGLVAMPAMAQAPPAPPPQLDQLVKRIALYPDPLLAQVLTASTFWDAIPDAAAWANQHSMLHGDQLAAAIEEDHLPWDPSVLALLPFPQVLNMMAGDPGWTQALGNAVLVQRPDVMDAVQRMRSKAQQAGKLSSTPQQTVTTTNDNGQPEIAIQPANPQMMYVPNYDPAYFWGPPLYYPYASWFYPPYGGGAYWGFGMGIPMGLYFGGGWGGWGGWGWGFGWGGHSLMINNSFIHRYNFNSRGIGSLNGTSAWSHDASHRQGVPYSNSAVSNRYGGNVRQNLQSRASASQAQSRGASRAESRAAASQSRAERMGNRQVSRSAPNQNRSAFGGVRDGSAARMQSDHGYSSLGPARSNSGGGGVMRGGGGGMRGGGGGGGGNRGGGRR